MSKKQSKDGVTLTINSPTSNYEIFNIVDIDVQPGVGSVTLDIDSLSRYSNFNVKLKNINKQFPDVRVLILNGHAYDIEISNYMFPNVTNVIVQGPPAYYSRRVIVGRNGCLLHSTGSGIGYKLLNTFCKKAGEEIDLKDVCSIEDYAFAGCMSTNVINTDDITCLSKKSFANSAFQLGGSFVNGVKYINGMIVDIDTSAKEIDIPENVMISGVDITENCRFDKITIHSKHSIGAIVQNSGSLFDGHSGCDIPCDVLYLDFNNDEFETSVLHAIDTKAFKLSDKNRFCSEYDGILYDRNMDTLICCPSKKTGSMLIPEGVKYIGDCSCSDTEITSLKLPNTLKSIGYRAFSGNRKLTNIDFGSGIKNIGAGFGGMTFFACDALTKVEIPSNVKLIGESAFANCWNLSNLIFNEGLESIGPNAFRNCNLSEIMLPKSVRRLCDAALNGAKNIEVPGIIPVNFLHAVLKTDDGARPNDLFDIVEVTDGSNKLFFPMYLEVNKKDDLQRSLGYKTLAEVVEDKNFINRPGECSRHLEAKQNIAVKVYGYNQNPEIRTYLRRAATSITKRYIAQKDEERLVEFLKLNLMTMSAMNKILPQVKHAEMTSATAYLLNAINNAGGNKKTFRL